MSELAHTIGDADAAPSEPSQAGSTTQEDYSDRLEHWLVVAYAASLPLSLTLSWAILIAGLVLWATRCVRQGARQAGVVLSAPLSLPLFAFAFCVSLSGAVAGGLSEAWGSLWSLKTLIVYFWAYQACAFNEKTAIRACQAVLSVSAVAGFWGMAQQLTGFHPFGYQYLQGTGFLGGPMAFAGQMQIFSLVALALYLRKGQASFGGLLSREPVFLAVLAGNLLGVFFASERSAWLGGICGALAVTAVLSLRTFARCLLCLALIFALGWFCVPVVKQRLEPLTNWRQDVSTRVRLTIWTEAVRVWQDSPAFGVGVRKFPHFDIPEAIVPGRSKDLNHAHSNYVHVLATTGIVGSCSFMWLSLAALYASLSAFRQAASKWRRDLCLGIFGSVVALMVSGLFEYNFGTAQVRLAQWFFLAMVPAVGLAAIKQSPDGESV